MTKDYLVYLTTGFHPLFAKLTALCVRSIVEHCDMGKIDVCILCDAAYRPVPEAALGAEGVGGAADVRFHTTAANPHPVMSSFRKLEVFNIPDILAYKQVMFLDSDIVVCGDLCRVFEAAGALAGAPAAPDVLHVFEEDYRDPHRAKWFSFCDYIEADVAALDAAGIRGFNAGQFLFAPSVAMRDHFHAIIAMANAHQGVFHYEQSVMNVYFNHRRPDKRDTRLLADVVRLSPPAGAVPSGHIIVHFNGDGEAGPEVKYAKMRAWYDLWKK